MRVEKQHLAAKKPTRKRQSDSLKKSQLALSHRVLMKGELLSMKMMMNENQLS
jgi:hypothetical protein